MATKELEKYTYQNAKEEIQKIWNNYRVTSVEQANQAGTRAPTQRRNRNWEPRNCTHCPEQLPHIAKTHNTENCRYENHHQANVVETKQSATENDNKGGKHYSNLTFLYDSGASKSMVKEKPK